MFQGNWEIWLQSNISFIIAVVNRRKCFSSLHRERKIMMGTHTEHKHTRLMETKHSPCGLKSLSREPEREAEAEAEAACQASSVSYVKLTGLMEEEGQGSCTYTHILLKNHTKRSDHTSRIHPNHTKHTHTQPLYLFRPPHPPHSAWWRQAQIVGPGYCEPAESERPAAVNACDCIECNCVCVFMCVSYCLRSRPDRGGDQLEHKQGSQIIGLCSVQTGKPASPHTEYCADCNTGAHTVRSHISSDKCKINKQGQAAVALSALGDS